MTTGESLRVQNVTKRYGGITAVDDVSFEVRAGELVGLIGPNGAGKSTLIDLITGMQKPTAGEVFLGEASLAKVPAHVRRHMGIGRTFQLVKPFQGMSVVENVVVAAMFSRAKPLSRRESYEQAIHWLDFVGLAGRADSDAAQLNLADRKLLELARALASKPKLLLLDEVMGGLDKDASERLIGVIRAVNAEGVTVVMIEHVLKALFKLVDRLVVLQHGRLIAKGSVDEVISDQSVIEAYLGTRFAAKKGGAE